MQDFELNPNRRAHKIVLLAKELGGAGIGLHGFVRADQYPRHSTDIRTNYPQDGDNGDDQNVNIRGVPVSRFATAARRDRR